MKIKYVYILLVFVISILVYLLPKLFIAVPKSLELAKIENSKEFSIVLPRGEGFEPWIAVKNCVPFEINLKIFDESNKKIYSVTLNNRANQLDRLGDLLPKYKNRDFCKFLIVQNDREKWKLFKYGKKYTIKVDVKKIPKNTNIYLNIDYLSIWFPRSTRN